jgi:signal transduction histidine kinase
LEQRVAERDRELQDSYTRLKDINEEKAALAERARIMRDIHDGVGAQLVGLVSLLQTDIKRPEELREHAQSALDELRMAVDSLQPVEGSISTVLATLRYRLQARLKAAGIDVQWEVDDLPALENLTPSAVLQVQRILLEAFTNVIRHSQASVVQVRALHLLPGDGSQRISLCVDDNGQASKPDSASSSSGHGQSNMRWRAQAIGANLHIEQSPMGGVRVRLEWILT